MFRKHVEYELKDPEYGNELVGHIKKAKREKSYCDVILRSGEHEVFAHRVVLTYSSDYFSLFFNCEIGDNKSIIEFDENIIKASSLISITDFAYSGEIDISHHNVVDLYVASDYLGIEFIKKKCELYLNLYQRVPLLCKENFIDFIYLTCYYDLPFLFDRVCEFISNNFVEFSEILCTFLSPYCMLKIINNDNFTACDHKIPVSDVELEIFTFIVQFIAEKDIPDTTIAELLGTIHFRDIQSEMISSVVESHKNMKNQELFHRLLMLSETPSCLEKKDKGVYRKYSKEWKYMHVHHPTIDIHDRICSITMYHKDLKVESNIRMAPLIIVGLSINYTSGKLISIGKTFDEKSESFKGIFCESFELSHNEVILEIKNHYENDFYLNMISFTSNFRKAFGPAVNETMHNSCNGLCPESVCGYLHSFESSSTICDLKPLWVEYRKPIKKNTSAFEFDSWTDTMFNPNDSDYKVYKTYLEFCSAFEK